MVSNFQRYLKIAMSRFENKMISQEKKNEDVQCEADKKNPEVIRDRRGRQCE